MYELLFFRHTAVAEQGGVMRSATDTYLNPRWFHLHGRKMRFVPGGSSKDAVVIRSMSGASELIIKKFSLDGELVWKVEWQVVLSQHESDTGKRIVQTEWLHRMFDIPPHRGENFVARPVPMFSRKASKFLRDYQGEDGEPGHFIRQFDKLNIPGPGTGHNGSGTISIEITQEMQDAIAVLIDRTTGVIT